MFIADCASVQVLTNRRGLAYTGRGRAREEAGTAKEDTDEDKPLAQLLQGFLCGDRSRSSQRERGTARGRGGTLTPAEMRAQLREAKERGMLLGPSGRYLPARSCPWFSPLCCSCSFAVMLFACTLGVCVC